MTSPVLPPIGPKWDVWARQVTTFLQRTVNRLAFRRGADVPAEDGIILWDEVAGYPTVSKDGEWRQIVLADGDANLVISSNVSTAVDTATALTFTMASGNGISLGSPASRIVFERGGTYMLSFSAQIDSTSGSAVDFWFWPRINGVDIPSSAMKNTLHSNQATKVTSRASLFDFEAGDYLEAMWAVSSTDGRLEAFTATAFAPATPAATLAITRLKA